jgi:hypothetical protein
MDEEDDEDEEVVTSDGDVLGDVVGATGTKRRKDSILTSVLPEDAWELETDDMGAPVRLQCSDWHGAF